MSFDKCLREIEKLKNPKKAEILARFFKTGKGEYGEGDVFLGLISEEIKNVAKKYEDLDLNDVQKLLDSKIHEHRVCALRILTYQYKKLKKNKLEKKIIDFYLQNTRRINNWDLVDLSAPKILGDYMLKKDKKILYKLARSKNLWEKRIAIIATYTFIKNKKFDDALKISEILLFDSHDLIHKAVGWMLREIGKIDQRVEEKFLMKYYKDMSRTMLRYAIEKFPEDRRQFYLNIKRL